MRRYVTALLTPCQGTPFEKFARQLSTISKVNPLSGVQLAATLSHIRCFQITNFLFSRSFGIERQEFGNLAPRPIEKLAHRNIRISRNKLGVLGIFPRPSFRKKYFSTIEKQKFPNIRK